MPYVSKTDRQAILTAGIEQVAESGLRSLSLRGIATKLDLTPNALYRYFADRAALEAAISAESAVRLHAVLQRAAGKKSPEQALRSMANAYLQFARENPNLYDMMVDPSRHDANCTFSPDVWSFVVQHVAKVAGSNRSHQASVALWALLHGVISLERASVFGPDGAKGDIRFGLDAWFAAAAKPPR
jgi:AcrR family transcriptional regulator